MNEVEAVKALVDCGYVVQCLGKNDYEWKYGLDMTQDEWEIVKDYCNDPNNLLEMLAVSESEVEDILCDLLESIREVA
jgi:hypothetical protein